MASLMKENGHGGAVVQVFRPNKRLVADTLTVTEEDVVRFSANGQYEMNSDGVKVPFPAGRTIGIPHGVTEVKIYDAAGTALAAQVVEVM